MNYSLIYFRGAVFSTILLFFVFMEQPQNTFSEIPSAFLPKISNLSTFSKTPLLLTHPAAIQLGKREKSEEFSEADSEDGNRGRWTKDEHNRFISGIIFVGHTKE